MTKQKALTQVQMLDTLKAVLLSEGRRYRKCRNILAKRAAGGEKIATITADGVETVNVAKKGDYIVRNETEAREQYIIAAENFHRKYAAAREAASEEWQPFRPISEITALELSAALLRQLELPDKFRFIARWGEPMIAKKGDFLAIPASGDEIYRIACKEFFETYEAAG